MRNDKLSKKRKNVLYMLIGIIILIYIGSFISGLTEGSYSDDILSIVFIFVINIGYGLIQMNKIKSNKRENEKRLILKEERLKKERLEEERLKEEELRKKQKEKELLDLVFEKHGMERKFKSFIIENTKKYDEYTMGISQYMGKVDDFLEYINIVVGNNLNINDVSKEGLRDYIDNKKESYYVDDMNFLLKIEDYTDLNNIVKTYLNIYMGIMG